jgi:hypothetical protein
VSRGNGCIHGRFAIGEANAINRSRGEVLGENKR